MANIWHGTEVEARALKNAINRECVCTYVGSTKKAVCPGHKAIIEDQRFLNGLLFMRHKAEQLLREEFNG